jgi:hypothetical protein
LNKRQSKHRLFFRLTAKAKQILWTDISCLGGVFTKNTSRETTNLVSQLLFFANTPPNMIYMFNYTEYYCFTFTLEHFRDSNLIIHVTLRIKVKKKYSEWIWRFESCEGIKVKYIFAEMEKKSNPYANTPAAEKINKMNPKYENTRQIHRLLTNLNPGFLYNVSLIITYHGMKLLIS